MKHEKRIQQIAVYYGAWHQIEKSAEELTEAAEACRQYMDRPDVERFEHLAEELADAQIMIDQLRRSRKCSSRTIRYTPRCIQKRQRHANVSSSATDTIRSLHGAGLMKKLNRNRDYAEH